jgi:hypothetical protein
MLHHKVKNAQVKTRIFFVGTPPASCGIVPAASARIDLRLADDNLLPDIPRISVVHILISLS